jgi:hypothetical protein
MESIVMWRNLSRLQEGVVPDEDRKSDTEKPKLAMGTPFRIHIVTYLFMTYTPTLPYILNSHNL